MRSLIAVVLIAVVIGAALYLQTDTPGALTASPLSARTDTPRTPPLTLPPTASAAERQSGALKAAAAGADPEPSAAPLVRSDSAFQGVFFAAERGLTDLAEQLAIAQAAIADGSIDAQFDLARIAANCELAEELNALANGTATADAVTLSSPSESLTDPRNAGSEWTLEVERLGNECAAVLEARPAGLSTAEWQVQSLRKAAEQGHPLAMLELVLEHDSTAAPYTKVLDLVQTAVQSDDYRAYFLAADFLNEFHDPAGADINEARAMEWFYLGCRHSPYCEPSILEAQLALDYTPAQIDRFKTFADDAEAAINGDQPIEFEAGWLGLNSDR